MVLGQQTVQQAALSLGRDFLGAGDPQFEKVYVENIQKVTAEQIRDVARRYFVPQRLNQVTIFPPGRPRKRQRTRPAPAKTKSTSSRLPNGLRVLVKRHSHLPMINIQAAALCGSLADNEQTDGRSSLVAAMLDQGTADHSAPQIAEYFDSIGANFTAEAGRFTIFAGLTAMREDFPKAAALFAECVNRPAFPQKEFKENQALALGAIARRDDNSQAQIAEFFFDSLPAKSPYHLLLDGESRSRQATYAQGFAGISRQVFRAQQYDRDRFRRHRARRGIDHSGQDVRAAKARSQVRNNCPSPATAPSPKH